VTGLFIGVVSHTQTQYLFSQGPQGLATLVAGELSQRGFKCTVCVNTENLWDPSVLPLTEAEAYASQVASLGSEISWENYLNASGTHSYRSRLRKRFILALRQMKLKATHSLLESHSATQVDVASVKRLMNIELSHVDLWRRGIESQADWILIVEDDGSSANIPDLAEGLAQLLTSLKDSVQPAYLNVSESFGAQELGTRGLLSPAPLPWRGTTARSILQSSRPITNTVCAVLYRRTFLVELQKVFVELPMTPVLPIDFKLNEALQILHSRGSLGAGDCWQIDPAPIVQLSMHSDGMISS
jgi:hypothetical protein